MKCACSISSSAGDRSKPLGKFQELCQERDTQCVEKPSYRTVPKSLPVSLRWTNPFSNRNDAFTKTTTVPQNFRFLQKIYHVSCGWNLFFPNVKRICVVLMKCDDNRRYVYIRPNVTDFFLVLFYIGLEVRLDCTVFDQTVRAPFAFNYKNILNVLRLA